MKYCVLSLLFSFIFSYSPGQMFYDFESELSLDNWTEETSQYVIRNGKLSLNGNSTKALILHPSIAIDSTTWELDFELDFNPSSSNYFIAYLVLSAQTVEQSEGYYLKVGRTKDNFSLYRIKENNHELILQGKENRLDYSEVKGTIKIHRSIHGVWEIHSKINLETEFSLEGQTTDITFSTNYYFGLECIYTSTRRDKFHFDNIKINGEPYRDRTAPKITFLNATSRNHIMVNFNEEVNISNTTFEIKDLQLDLDTSYYATNTLHLVYNDLPNATQMQLIHSGFKDLYENFSSPDTIEFFCFYDEVPSPRDIVFSEIMIDPSPPNDLPEMEYVEIFNRSEKYFNLSNWILTDNNNYTRLDSLIIGPQEYVLFNQRFDETYANKSYQSMVPNKWPSLNNTGDSIQLLSNDSILIDLLSYDISYYRDKEKSKGGYSIESLDPFLPCQSKTNWSASLNVSGGTPGLMNSHPTDDALTLISNSMIDSSSLVLTFSKAIHCNNLNLNATSGDNISTFCEDNLLYLKSNDSFKSGTYSYTAENLQDCYDNVYRFQFEITIDQSPPKIISVSNIYEDQIEIVFSEPVSTIHYILIDNIPVDITYYSSRLDSISIQSEQLKPGNYELVIEVEDSIKNRSLHRLDVSLEKPEIAEFTDIVISEYLPEPTEGSTLPKYEFIEIYNRTDKVFPLRGYRIGDKNKTVIIEDGYINPFEYVILCPSPALEEFQQFGKTIPVKKWPAINNESDSIVFLNSLNGTIFQVHYNQSYFENLAVKPTIEKIDLDRLCSDKENWQLSSSRILGTPGALNSSSNLNPDIKAPSILSAVLAQEDKIRFESSEPIHPFITPILEVSPSPEITQIEKLTTHFEVTFEDDFNPNSKILYKIKQLRDCNDNYSEEIIGEIIVPGKPESGDIIINEVMFDPESLVSEFIELFNYSEKYIQLSEINLGINGTVITLPKKILLPKQFIVITRDPESISHRYSLQHQDLVLGVNLKTLRNDSSEIELLYENSTIDSARYNEKWHFELIEEPKGVSLERISPTSNGLKMSSWVSASSTSGFATPGRRNSHFNEMNLSSNLFSVYPSTISPNNDGYQDIAFINYKVDQPGTMSNIRIFDTRGNHIKEIANNELLQSEGFFRWDGTDESGVQLQTNYYIVLIEIYNNQGFSKRERLKIGLFQNNF